MRQKHSLGGQKVVPSKGKKRYVGCPKGAEPRPAFVDYKDVATLKTFLTPQGKLFSRKRTGLSSAAQHALARAVKRARFLALLPYVGD
jgi:small subunit ribosomal protein S18